MEAMAVTPSTNITDLPSELLELIFRKLSFDTVAKLRCVCQRFNRVAASLLNSEFSRLRMNMLHRFNSIKAVMPRRESARRRHPLARESDIVETLHMRLTLLHMTFGKHIERKYCCFFAGEILDEVYRILNYIKTNVSLNRAYKVTDELFDLSTMAMEYFKEHIEPSLPEITYFASDFLEYSPIITSLPKTQMSLFEEPALCSSGSSSRLESGGLSNCNSNIPAVVKMVRKLCKNVKKNSNQVTDVRKELKEAKKLISSQQKQINELKALCGIYNRKLQNSSRKLSAVTQELNCFRAEFQSSTPQSSAAACSTVSSITESSDVNSSLTDMSLHVLSAACDMDRAVSTELSPVVISLSSDESPGDARSPSIVHVKESSFESKEYLKRKLEFEECSAANGKKMRASPSWRMEASSDEDFEKCSSLDRESDTSNH